ncbi:hypothetical protein FALCPG4_013651 [Fusarium falciforme]
MSTINLPSDVVAIDTSNGSLLFYVAPDRNDSRLSYLESPDAKGGGNYEVQKIFTAADKAKKNKKENIIVSPNNKQVAAVTWHSAEGIQVRVYYVNENEHLREVCKTGDGDWYIGALGFKGNTIKIRPNTSISASVHAYSPSHSSPSHSSPSHYSLRVFAAEDNQINHRKLPQISVFRYVVNESSESTWQGDHITNDIESY